MQPTNFIEFKKQRELGEILSDTFGFLRLEFKPFFTTLLKIVGPYLLILLVATGFYLFSFGDLFNIALVTSENSLFSPIILIISGAVLFISSIMVYAVSYGGVLFYIKEYIDHTGTVEFQKVKKQVYANFWSFIGLGFLVGISLLVGFMMCLVPGIYLAVPLGISFAIMVFQNLSATDSYSESFRLVKDNWWNTFAVFIVLYIVVYVASLAFSLPTVIYSWISMGIFSGEFDAESINAFTDPVYLLLNLITRIVQFLMNIVLLVASALIYFNLNEKKNFTGTFERIDNLGKTTEE
ncbi:Hypothetical protein I595_3481 [Croceitalea dokdonensis DOKDO 023]|uniref:Glycerophosphoryl diester phosphodiesterase membrane domain-containing protein n=1 Tax=Croceitalea dokdonensis DOKDO 023 TaxID=1300341 RepID=A0A0N8H3F9_9FLAO|nr:hypothetical protein [Croceitalea dokdonensis]KPM30460.1 Hypothetical protein I595_3481 [Croceitalea dokdonensis DOKDO 023]